MGQETKPARNGDNNSTDNNSEADEDPPSHRITVSVATNDIDEGSVRCQFAELPAGAQEEVKNAIGDLRSNSEETGHYTTYERPELLDTDCYAVYIHYENQYYFTEVDALGG